MNTCRKVGRSRNLLPETIEDVCDSLMPSVEMRNLEQMFPDSRVLIRHKTENAGIACHHDFDFLFPSDNGGCMLANDFWERLLLCIIFKSKTQDMDSGNHLLNCFPMALTARNF